jgi:hypothetical protein
MKRSGTAAWLMSSKLAAAQGANSPPAAESATNSASRWPSPA